MLSQVTQQDISQIPNKKYYTKNRYALSANYGRDESQQTKNTNVNCKYIKVLSTEFFRLKNGT